MARHDVGRGAANLHPATPPGPGVSGHALSRVKLRSTYILQRRTSQMSAVSAWRAVGLWICSTYLLQRRTGRTSAESTSRGGGQGAAAHLHPVTPSRPDFSGFHATRYGWQSFISLTACDVERSKRQWDPHGEGWIYGSTYRLQRRTGWTLVGSP